MSAVVGRGPSRSAAPVVRDRRRRPLLLLVACVVLAIAAAAVASRLSAPDRLATASDRSSSLRLPGGAVEVLAVTPELMAHTPGMPSAMMPGEPLADDERRVTVQLVLTAGRDGLRFDGGDFRLGARGEAGSAPERDGVGEGRLQADYRMDGELVFRVPGTADALVLTETRSGRSVEVEVEEGAGGTHASSESEPSPAASASPPPHGHSAPHGAGGTAPAEPEDAGGGG